MVVLPLKEIVADGSTRILGLGNLQNMTSSPKLRNFRIYHVDHCWLSFVADIVSKQRLYGGMQDICKLVDIFVES